MKILVTGHQGFIGSHFWDHFLKASGDHELVGVDIKSGHDVRDFCRTSDERFDLVVHCAAVIGGREMIDGNPLGVAINLALDAEMFNWALKTRPDRFVYFSSSAAYPIEYQNGNFAPLSESQINLHSPKMPDQTYGWAKLTGEMLVEQAKRDGLNVFTFRPFSGYGTDQSLDYPFPSFVDRASRRVPKFEIWGDGQQSRDFIHVDDIIGAVLAALDHDIQEPINLGSGIATSFNELADLVVSAVGGSYKPEIVHLTEKPVGVMHRICNPSKLESFYKLKVDLKEGVRRAIAGDL